MLDRLEPAWVELRAGLLLEDMLLVAIPFQLVLDPLDDVFLANLGLVPTLVVKPSLDPLEAEVQRPLLVVARC